MKKLCIQLSIILMGVSSAWAVNINEDYLICRDFHTDKKWSKVVDYCSRSIKTKPDGNVPYILRCEANYMLDSLNSAISDCSTVIGRKLLPKEQLGKAYLLRAQAGYGLGLYKNALNDVKNASQLQFGGGITGILKGDILYKLKQYTEADACYSTLINKSSKYYGAVMGRAQSRVHLKNYKGAFTDLTNSILRFPKKGSTRLSLFELYTMRSMIASKLENYEQAFSDIESARKIDDTNYQLYVTKGDIKKRLSDYHGAIKAYTEALKRNPQSTKLLVHRAEAYLGLNEYKAVIKDCNAALKIERSYAQAYYVRGMAKLQKDIHDNSGLQDLSEAADLGMFSVYATMKEVHIRRGK